MQRHSRTNNRSPVPCCRGWFCTPGCSCPGLSGSKLWGAEAEPHCRPGIRRGATRSRRAVPGPRAEGRALGCLSKGREPRSQGTSASDLVQQRKLPCRPRATPRESGERTVRPSRPLSSLRPLRTLPKSPRERPGSRPPAEEVAAAGLGSLHFMGGPWGFWRLERGLPRAG